MTPERMADHWTWRRGWRPGRRMYTWHVTFPDRPEVRALAAAYQARLAGLPGLDPVPARWLHLTTQRVGFTDEVSDADLAAIIDAARGRLADLSPAVVTFGPARVTPEAILLDVTPVAGLAATRAGLRAAIGDVWPGRMPGPEEWTPHVTVAYSRTTAPAAPYAAALAGAAGTGAVGAGSAGDPSAGDPSAGDPSAGGAAAGGVAAGGAPAAGGALAGGAAAGVAPVGGSPAGGAPTARIRVEAVRLIVLGRDQHQYEWTTRAELSLSR